MRVLPITTNAIRSDSSNLSLKGEDIFKFIEALKSEETSQAEKVLQRVEGNPKASDIDKAMAETYRLQLDGKIEEAIKKWRSIANVTEGSDSDFAAGAWFLAAYLQSKEGWHEGAITNFSKALDLKSDYVEAYYSRGASKLNISEYKEAIADFDKVLELDPDHTEAYYSRGFANLSVSKYEEAADNFKKALELKPDYVEARWGLKDAKLRLESIKRLNPNTANAEAYYHKGTVKLNVSEYKEAIANFSKALELKPNYVKAYHGRGAAKFSIGQYQSAVADYNKIIRLKPESPSPYANRGEAKIKLKQYESAIGDCDKAIQLDPNYAYAYYIRADAKFYIGEIAGGESDLKTALKLAEKVEDEKLKDQIELRTLINTPRENHRKKR